MEPREIRGLKVLQVQWAQLGNQARREIQGRLENQEHLACQVRREDLGSRVAWGRWVRQVFQVIEAGKE